MDVKAEFDLGWLVFGFIGFGSSTMLLVGVLQCSESN